MAVSTPTLPEVRSELMQLLVQEDSLLILPELRSELTQLLVQEDRLLVEYKRVHEDYHFRQRKARTGDEFQDHMMGLKERLVGARMKVLGMDLRDVAERRRELLKQVRNNVLSLA